MKFSRMTSYHSMFFWLFLLTFVDYQQSGCNASKYLVDKIESKLISKYRATRYGDAENCGKRKRNVENRKCFRQCTSDSDCRGSKRRCLCDGECGLSCVRITTACNKITEFENGVVNYHPDNYFGSQLIYDCNPGFTLVGNKTRVCEGDGWWSGFSPICAVEKFCDPPISIPNTIPNVQINNQSRFKIGTEVEYQCDIGYTSLNTEVTNNKIVCTDSGKWSDLKFKCIRINCGKPDEVDNGIIKGSDVFYSSVIEYKCMPGFRIRHGDYLRECGLNGKWSGRQPTCDPIDCGEPPYVKNAMSIYNSTEFGSYVVYACISSKYKLLAQPEDAPVTCMPNGQWQNQPPKCIEKTCTLNAKEYSAPKYHLFTSNSNPKDVFVYGINTFVRFACQADYELHGTSQLTCKSSEHEGVWSDKLPLCLPIILCPRLDLLAHNVSFKTSAEPKPAGGYTLNTTVEFFCPDRSYILLGSKTHVCAAAAANGTPAGVWLGDKPQCQLRPTTTTTTTTTTTSTTSTTTTSSTSTPPPTSTTSDATAQSDSACHLDLSNIRISYYDLASSMQTSAANELVFVNVSGRGAQHVANGSVLGYHCKHAPVGNQTLYLAKCLNGVLLLQHNCNDSMAKVNKACRPPPKIVNGYNKYGSSQHGSKALYQCFNGFELIKGHGELKCIEGDWVGSIPYCSKMACDFPGVLKNGKIFYIGTLSEYAYKSYMKTAGQNKQIRYECEKDYKLHGPSGSTCINGQWKPNPMLVKCAKEDNAKLIHSIESQPLSHYQPAVSSSVDEEALPANNNQIVLYKRHDWLVSADNHIHEQRLDTPLEHEPQPAHIKLVASKRKRNKAKKRHSKKTHKSHHHHQQQQQQQMATGETPLFYSPSS